MAGFDEFVKAIQFGAGLVGGFGAQAQKERRFRSAQELQLLKLGLNEGDTIERVPSGDINRPSGFFNRAFGTGQSTDIKGAPVSMIGGSGFRVKPFEAAPFDFSSLLGGPSGQGGADPVATARNVTPQVEAAPGTLKRQETSARKPTPAETIRTLRTDPLFKDNAIIQNLVTKLLRSPRSGVQHENDTSSLAAEITRVRKADDLQVRRDEEHAASTVQGLRKEQTRLTENQRTEDIRARNLIRNSGLDSAGQAKSLAKYNSLDTPEEKLDFVASVTKASDGKAETAQTQKAVRRIGTLLERKRRIVSGESGGFKGLLQDILSNVKVSNRSKLSKDVATANNPEATPGEQETAKQNVLRAIDAEINYWKQFAPQKFLESSGLIAVPKAGQTPAPMVGNVPITGFRKIR